MDHSELQDLVNPPRERLDVEYKAWLNLRDREVQAGLAGQLCALANHGAASWSSASPTTKKPAGPQRFAAGPYV